MRTCNDLSMGEKWLMRPSYSFATSVGEGKSTCSVLGFDSHFQNFGTILFWYCRILFRCCFILVLQNCVHLVLQTMFASTFIWYCGKTLCSSGTMGEGLRSSGIVGKNMRSSDTMGEGLHSSGTGQKYVLIRYCRRGSMFIRYWEKICVHLVLVKVCIHSVLGKNKYAFIRYWAKRNLRSFGTKVTQYW
jgi:hypothetical protein